MFKAGDKVVALRDSGLDYGYKTGDIFTVKFNCEGEDSDHFVPVEASGVAFYSPKFEKLKEI